MNKLMISSIFFITIFIGITAILFAPNSWDSMTYHLPRIMHWIQNHDIYHYPTNCLRQLSYCPFSEYITATIIIMTGSDRFINLIQFFAMIFSWIMVYKITIKIINKREIGLLAVFLCATLPMGILQGSSTQTDYIATFLLSSFVYSILSNYNPIIIGVILGLTLLTKGYCYLYALPFLFLSNNKGLIISIAFLINLFYFAQNLLTFGNLFGYTANVEFGNPFRNFIGHIASVMRVSLDEDHTGNPWHFGILLFTLCTIFWSNRNYRSLNKYFCCIVSMIILAIIGIKWNPWICRFQLPIFVLASPLMAVVLYKRKYINLIIILLILLSLPFLFFGKPRSILNNKSRIEQYFIKRPDDYKKYKNISIDIALLRCKNVGIISNEDSWEYPLWVMNKGVRFEHINVNNVSNEIEYSLGEFKPCYEVKL